MEAFHPGRALGFTTPDLSVNHTPMLVNNDDGGILVDPTVGGFGSSLSLCVEGLGFYFLVPSFSRDFAGKYEPSA